MSGLRNVAGHHECGHADGCPTWSDRLDLLRDGPISMKVLSPDDEGSKGEPPVYGRRLGE